VRQVSAVGDATLRLAPVSVGPALPGLGAEGAVVDRAYALRAADGADASSTQQVWVAPSAAATFPQKLKDAGVTILGTQSAASQTDLYQRQGPALAVLLFLAGAALGALLASGGTALSLHLAGRRRTYEVAAMSALDVRRRTLLASLFGEQGLLLIFGVGIGVAAGVAGAILAVPSVPEFADMPAAPPLLYGLQAGPVFGLAAGAVAILVAVIAASSAALLRGSRFSQLREAPA
jgi:ABC-type antimicrobial peptide transport system permease subunit